MKKIGLGEQINFFKEQITEYNCITEIISSDDRNEGTIENLKMCIMQAVSKNGLSNTSATTLNRILTYYQAMNGGIKLAFSIMFKCGHIWNVEYTSSERSDRTEGLVARLSRNLSDRNYIVIGDYGKTYSCRKRPTVDPRANVLVVSMEEFVDDLLYEIFSYNKNGKAKIPLSKSPMSQINGQRGPFWEKCIAESLQKQGGFMPLLYELIMDQIMLDEGFNEGDIESVTANCVGTQGKKTDVAVCIVLKSGKIIKKNISAKASGQEKVSLHQAKASDFKAFLKISDKAVVDALEKFEKYGNMSGMTDADEKVLKDYFAEPIKYQAFLDWCFMGPSGSLDYLILHSYERDELKVNNHTRIYKVIDYMDEVKKKVKIESGFGTGLVWTYKSVKSGGKKRNEIQLKVPLI